MWIANNKIMKDLVRILFIIPLLPLISGCGNISTGAIRLSSTNGSYGGTWNGYDSPTDGYSCPFSDNILSQMQVSLAGSYSVCENTSTGDQNDLLVLTHSANGKYICLIPAQSTTSPSDGSWFNGPGGLPYSVCGQVTSNEQVRLTVSMPGGYKPYFDSAYVTLQQNLVLLQNCLLRGGLNCPDYAYGTFR